MEPRVRRKAYVYCVDAGRLLVFRHVGRSPYEVGLQVPGGTIRDDELPEDAAFRELLEETGRAFFELESFLGTASYNIAPYRAELQERFFYRARLTKPAPQRWTGGEHHDGLGEPTPFEFFWIPLSAGHVLQAGQGALLWRVGD